MRFSTSLISIALGILLVAGCQSLKNPTKDWTAQRFYEEAKAAMAAGNYEVAIERFEGLEARYPYGRYAEQAQLEIGYAFYKNSQPELAIQAADRFIRLHPTHPHVAYAYYLKGLVNISEERGIMSLLKSRKREILDRDPGRAQEAYNAFREVAERFPSSVYARDAALRMAYLHNALAKYEVSVARFYLNQEAYVAAVNRCKQVLENYQNSPAVEDALGILAEAYKLMGLEKLMDDTLRVLATNFPESQYLQPPGGKNKKNRKQKKGRTAGSPVQY